jgi:hypothetical protein
VDEKGGSSNQSDYGKLIIHSIPTREIEAMVVSYLTRMAKNVPAKKMAQKVRRTPLVLSKNIAVKKGETIAQNLRDLGARAELVPHKSGAQIPTRVAGLTSAPEISSHDLLYEKNEPRPPKEPKSDDTAKKLITTVVVIVLVAVLTLLAWQVYDLLFD